MVEILIVCSILYILVMITSVIVAVVLGWRNR